MSESVAALDKLPVIIPCDSTATTATSAADTKESEVSFRSRQSTFTTDLLEPSSLAFQTRAALIKGQVCVETSLTVPVSNSFLHIQARFHCRFKAYFFQQLEPFFLASFSSYQSMTVHSFRYFIHNKRIFTVSQTTLSHFCPTNLLFPQKRICHQ